MNLYEPQSIENEKEKVKTNERYIIGNSYIIYYVDMSDFLHILCTKQTIKINHR